MFTKWSDDDHNLNEIEFVETAITILKPCLEESLGRSTIYWKNRTFQRKGLSKSTRSNKYFYNWN